MAEILSFFTTLLINIAIGVVVFFFLLIAMNGYSESDAAYGFIAYIASALFVSLLMAVCAVRVVVLLMKRKFSSSSSAFIAIPIFCVVGAGLKLACAIVGVAVAEYVRVNH
ncbi:MAG TPA: hypothetical protein VJV05_10480 [Pyrinomonadaceae bacterium]|nr:hypothetical protein [Pyrinomonadaceae bacterium]